MEILIYIFEVIFLVRTARKVKRAANFVGNSVKHVAQDTAHAGKSAWDIFTWNDIRRKYK